MYTQSGIDDAKAALFLALLIASTLATDPKATTWGDLAAARPLVVAGTKVF